MLKIVYLFIIFSIICFSKDVESLNPISKVKINNLNFKTALAGKRIKEVWTDYRIELLNINNNKNSRFKIVISSAHSKSKDNQIVMLYYPKNNEIKFIKSEEKVILKSKNNKEIPINLKVKENPVVITEGGKTILAGRVYGSMEDSFTKTFPASNLKGRIMLRVSEENKI